MPHTVFSEEENNNMYVDKEATDTAMEALCGVLLRVFVMMVQCPPC